MLNASIIERIDITDGLMIVRIKPDDGVVNFLPGQYVALGLFPDSPRIPGTVDNEEVKPDKIIRRSYSIGSSPEQKEYYEFYIAIVPDGVLTSRLAMLKVGDRLHVAPKVVGKFTIEDIDHSANLVFVFTGTGLAPFTAMIKTKSTWTPNRKIKLIHGVRYSQDLAYKNELEELAKINPNFSYYPIVSRAKEDWKGKKGYVQDFFTSGEIDLDPVKDHVMICGNPAMVDAVETLLTAKGYTLHSKKAPGNLHLEKYW